VISTGGLFVCITMTTTIIKNTNIKIKNEIDLVVGVDVGLTNWIPLSDGQVIDRPKFLAKSLKKKIKTLQRKFPLHTVTTYLNMLQVAIMTR